MTPVTYLVTLLVYDLEIQNQLCQGLDEMENSSIENTRKRLFAFLGIAFSLPVVFGFTVVDIIEGDILEAFINILMGAVFVTSFIGIKKWEADLLVYRLGLALLSVIFLYNVGIGSGNGTAIYWLFSFPLIVPCHRAVRSDRHFGGYQGGFEMKRILLILDTTGVAGKG